MAVAIRRPPSVTGTSVFPENRGQAVIPTTQARTSRASRDVFAGKRLKNVFSSPQAYVPRAFYRIERSTPEGGNLTEYLYAHGDVGGVVRYTEDVWAAVQQNNGQRPVGYGLGGNAYAVLGLTSVSSIATGAIAGSAGRHQLQHSIRVGDGTGVLAGVSTILRGILETCSGALFTSYRVMSLVPSVSAAALAGVATAGSTGFTAVYLAMCVTFSLTAHDIRQFWGELEEAAKKGVDEGYAFLQEAISPSDAEITAALKEIVETPSFAQQYQDEDELLAGYRAFREGNLTTSGVKQHIVEQFEVLQKTVPEATWKQLEEKVLATSHPKQRKANLANALTKLCEASERRITRVGRAVGSSVIHRLIADGKKAKPATKTQILTQATQKTKKHFWTYAVLAGVCAFGVAAFIASMVFTGGVPHLIAAVAMLATGVAMTLVDGYFLYEALQNNRPKKWENIAMWVFTMAFLAAAITATVLSGGVAPMIVLGAVSVCWLALFIYTQAAWLRPHDEKRRFDEDVRLGAPSAGA